MLPNILQGWGTAVKSYFNAVLKEYIHTELSQRVIVNEFEDSLIVRNSLIESRFFDNWIISWTMQIHIDNQLNFGNFLLEFQVCFLSFLLKFF